MKHLSFVRYLLLPGILFLMAQAALSQTAQVTGRVSDATGVVVPGAQITLTNIATGINREAVSNDEGYFTLPLLNPGECRIAVKKDSFKPLVQPSVVLQVKRVTQRDYTLETGAVTEPVNIAAATTAALETETSSLGKVIDQQRIQNLPLLGRNPYSLVALVPGARPSAGLNDLLVDQISQSFVSINGARGNQDEYLLDGAPNNAAAQNQPVVFVNPDAVQEFKVEANNFSVQYGRAERNGDFSQTRNAAGNVIPIYDPATTRADPAGGFLRGAKGGTYAGGMREPTIFWQPGTIKPGVVTDIGATLDLLPTFCAMAGVKAPSDRVLDGYDLSAALLSKGKSPREIMPYWRGSRLMALRHKSFKAHFITQSEYGGEAPKTHETPELYNLDIDPSEKWNIAAQHPDVIAEMRRLAEAHKQAIPPINNYLDKHITVNGK